VRLVSSQRFPLAQAAPPLASPQRAMADPAVDAVAGALGGMLALTATYPLMTANTHAQLHRQLKGATPTKLGGSLQELVEEGGVAALYDGIQPALLGTALSQAVYYFCYTGFRKTVASARGQPPHADLGVATSLAVAAAAGCVNVLATNPLWVAVTRLQAHRRAVARAKAQAEKAGGAAGAAPEEEAPTTLGTLRELFAREGVLGYWKGVGPSLIMVCNPTLQYGLYEWLVARLGHKPSRGEVFGLASLAKVGATLVTYPILVVKSRLQVEGSKAGGAEFAYGSTVKAVARIVQEEGPGALYRGMNTKIVQSVLAAALLFVTKDEISNTVHAVARRRRRAAAKAV